MLVLANKDELVFRCERDRNRYAGPLRDKVVVNDAPVRQFNGVAPELVPAVVEDQFARQDCPGQNQETLLTWRDHIACTCLRISATNASRSPPANRKPGKPAAAPASISVARSPMTKLPACRTGQCAIRSWIMPGLGLRQ